MINRLRFSPVGPVTIATGDRFKSVPFYLSPVTVEQRVRRINKQTDYPRIKKILGPLCVLCVLCGKKK